MVPRSSVIYTWYRGNLLYKKSCNQLMSIVHDLGNWVFIYSLLFIYLFYLFFFFLRSAFFFIDGRNERQSKHTHTHTCSGYPSPLHICRTKLDWRISEITFRRTGALVWSPWGKEHSFSGNLSGIGKCFFFYFFKCSTYFVYLFCRDFHGSIREYLHYQGILRPPITLLKSIIQCTKWPYHSTAIFHDHGNSHEFLHWV